LVKFKPDGILKWIFIVKKKKDDNLGFGGVMSHSRLSSTMSTYEAMRLLGMVRHTRRMTADS